MVLKGKYLVKVCHRALGLKLYGQATYPPQNEGQLH